MKRIPGHRIEPVEIDTTGQVGGAGWQGRNRSGMLIMSRRCYTREPSGSAFLISNLPVSWPLAAESNKQKTQK